MHLHGFTVEGLWQTRSMVSREIVGWWMLDLARATAGCKFTPLLRHLQKYFYNYCWWDSSKFSLAVTSIIMEAFLV